MQSIRKFEMKQLSCNWLRLIIFESYPIRARFLQLHGTSCSECSPKLFLLISNAEFVSSMWPFFGVPTKHKVQSIKTQYTRQGNIMRKKSKTLYHHKIGTVGKVGQPCKIDVVYRLYIGRWDIKKQHSPSLINFFCFLSKVCIAWKVYGYLKHCNCFT